MWRSGNIAARLGCAPKVDLSQRADPADLPELMETPASYEELRSCLQDLAELNRLTRAYAPTLRFLHRVTAQRERSSAPLRVLDIGSGYGDMLRVILRWAERRRLPVQLTGIALEPMAARAGAEADRRAGLRSGQIAWTTGNVFTHPGPPPDIIVSSLVMHHLRDPEIVALLVWMERTARLGWFINDLERAQRPYRWYGVLARIMRWHPYVQHDGPVSFRRAFRREDWDRLLEQAAVSGARILPSFPARLCVERIRQQPSARELERLRESRR